MAANGLMSQFMRKQPWDSAPLISGVDISGSTRDVVAPGKGTYQLGGHYPLTGLLATELGAIDEARVGQIDYHIRRRHVLDQLPEEEVRQEFGGAVQFRGVEL